MSGSEQSRPLGRPSTLQAMGLLVLPSLLLVGMLLTLGRSGPLYLLGQLAGAVFFLQAFVLLHEFGHRSFFPSRWANLIGGTLVSFAVFIPLPNWASIHELHHRWTGYRDKDPTTEGTFADALKPGQRRLINFCWRFWIPLFTLGYRLGIYWNIGKLKRHLAPRKLRSCLLHMLLYLAAYAAVVVLYPGVFLAMLPALLISFSMSDIMTLSQHSHVDMPVAGDREVKPLAYADQVQYSRSLLFPAWIARFVLLNFNYHEAHHAHPGVPCYRLSHEAFAGGNSYPAWAWIKRVKSMPGVDFIFRTDPNREGF
jgi:acyl-lipid omega-6 desaturase (Delta-12 desaturase)